MTAANPSPLERFDFDLPASRIAQQAKRRGFSRLMVLPPGKDAPPVHAVFRQLPGWLAPGDCMVVNDSRVLPARLWAVKKDTGGSVELLLHREVKPAMWEALSRPYRRLKPGTELILGATVATVQELLGEGKITLSFGSPALARAAIRQVGVVPLPPYIRRSFRSPNAEERKDRRRYQTIFARTEGSVAAPTAGLHFSKPLVTELRRQGVRVAPVTLHVGWGTFAPLSEQSWQARRLHPETYAISAETAGEIAECRRRKGRVIACGTTVARTLESAAGKRGLVKAGEGRTELFIQPGHRWQVVDGLLTNFHLPRSSLLVLVCALAGPERVMAAYAEAVRREYRFYSYGDAMLVFR
ncbi:MAG: tRNA preQ1(34) S-adenosylmethionine ribosyltransferase-isomerase QueA [candidate division FCPU426 bacterium]